MSVSLRWHGALPVVFAALLSLVVAGTVAAQGPAGTTLEFLPPGDGAVGQELMVAARLTDRSGVPVQGAEVLFLREDKFMNALSELELGRELTDAQGMATLTFV